MKIFLSWSGARSHAVAEALNDWLPRIIQAVKPFYSPEIEKGAKWSSEIDDALEGTRFGIVCLTPDNLKSTWVHFETGALSKTKDALIWTFLHGLTPGDVPQPLGKFQHTVAEKGDVLQLLKTINKRLAEVGGEPLQDRLLEENYELFWPQLEKRLSSAEKIGDLASPEKPNSEDKRPRGERAILDEMLELIRNQERRMIGFEEQLSAISPQQIKKTLVAPKQYSTLSFEIEAESGGNTEAVAEKIAAGIRPGFGETVVVVEPTPRGHSITAVFGHPVGRETIRKLMNYASLNAGYQIDEYETTWN